MDKSALSLIIAAAVVLGFSPVRARADQPAPQVGAPAPDFSLPSQTGARVSLSDLKGRWVVLYFYPKDFTHGCTIEAHNFQQDLSKYEKRDATIVGVSMQSAASHKDFCAKEGLHFKLLADTDGKVSQTYDSVKDFKVATFSARHTFLIDPKGVLRRAFLDVDPNKHSAEVLAALDELRKPSAR